MSPLEEALQGQKHLINKGYSVEEIQCAATMLIADELREINAVMQNVADEHAPPLEDDHADD